MSVQASRRGTRLWPVAVGAALGPGFHRLLGGSQMLVTAGLMSGLQLIDYWIPPRPSVDFTSFASQMLRAMAALAAMVFVSPWLATYVPQKIAYGVVGFATAMVVFTIAPIAPEKRTGKLWPWTLLAAGLATLWAYVGPWLETP